MLIITEPRLYLMGTPTYHHGEMKRFLNNNGLSGSQVHYLVEEDPENSNEPQGERHIEAAGRVCYLSFEKPRPGGPSAYIQHILDVGHGSVLEHATYNILIEHISRSCSHEIVRHRAGFGYSQLSQRYVDESVAEYIMPIKIQKDRPHVKDMWLRSIELSHMAYTSMVKDLLPDDFESLKGEERTTARKDARQAARSLLPNACETKIYMTGNLRAWRHFVELRGTKHAEPEIRAVAMKVYETLKGVAPAVFQGVDITHEGYIHSENPKV